MNTTMSAAKDTTRIINKIDKLTDLLAQEGIHIVKIRMEGDVTLDRKLRTAYIDVLRILKYEHIVALDNAYNAVRDGYFDTRCQLVVN